ncbi:hypothetical protein BHT94_05000 [Bacillus licheniformis]|nr:hypothetical protein BHT94_05000 [Bacillus licheniformis]
MIKCKTPLAWQSAAFFKRRESYSCVRKAYSRSVLHDQFSSNGKKIIIHFKEKGGCQVIRKKCSVCLWVLALLLSCFTAESAFAAGIAICPQMLKDPQI